MIQKIIISPFQKFVRIEGLSGILLFSATIIALFWANGPFGEQYRSLWQYKIAFGTKDLMLNKPLILWVNDGLMAVFFFLIGLEIKRELVIGELNSVKKASFPIVAAIGGMTIPVFLYLILNRDPEATPGWGIPMAADIAFSLAILNLLGKRVPIGLKVFLTAFAIIDDIGAVLVIAVFYSAGINWGLILIALTLLAILGWLAYRQIFAKYLILFFGIIIWVLFLKAGIHPTIAGVLLAFTVPIRQKIDVKTYTDRLCKIVDDIENSADNGIPILTGEQIEKIDDLEDWTSKVQSPLQHLEHRLHNWVAYFIMPVFALANAGVVFNSELNMDYTIILNVALSLFVGNAVGVSLISLLGLALKFTALPAHMKIRHLIGVSFLAGVGFTMSIFIANLAFSGSPEYIDSAKIGILAGSFISGLTGYLMLRFTSGTQVENT